MASAARNHALAAPFGRRSADDSPFRSRHGVGGAQSGARHALRALLG